MRWGFVLWPGVRVLGAPLWRGAVAGIQVRRTHRIDERSLMLKVRIIPCLDVKDGRVVKGVNFVSLRDAGDPVEQAIIYDAAGADELCFLDITASHEKRGILLDVVRRTAEACFMPLTVGGGVRTLDDIRALLLAAPTRSRSTPKPCAARNSCAKAPRNSAASASSPPSTPRRVGTAGFEVFTHGGRNATGIDAVEHAQKLVDFGAGEILLTSMDRDGTRVGLRSRADARGRRCGPRAGDRLGRRRLARRSGRRRARRPRQRGAGGLDLPFRRIHHRRRPRASRSRRTTCEAWMKYEDVKKHCLSLPGATVNIQWGYDHVFKVGGKMFAVYGMDKKTYHGMSFKVADDTFEILTQMPNIIPGALYGAREMGEAGKGERAAGEGHQGVSHARARADRGEAAEEDAGQAGIDGYRTRA